MRLVADLETNGLLEAVSVIHCLVTKDIDTGNVSCYHDGPFSPRDGSIEEGYELLQRADVVYFHNGIKYDQRVIAKLLGPALPNFPHARDTLVIARLIWPEIKKRDLIAAKQKKFPGQLCGRHSLEAWGHRLGIHKGSFKGPWDVFTQEMLDYCIQDIQVTEALLKRILAKNYSEEAIALEHRVQEIIMLQEDNGFGFNVAKAGELYGTLVQERTEIEAKLKATFAPWYVRDEEFTPKKDNAKQGYTAGVPLTKVSLTEFNPASRDHIADRLTKLYGWVPTVFTDGGKPQVDEKTMGPLSYSPIPILLRYLLIEKRIGQIAEGKEAWLKNQKDGRIYGAVNPMGTGSSRMSHSKPNIGQVPKVGSYFGAECRELFEPRGGWFLVGADASGIQLRILAHFMARFDDGAFSQAVVLGNERDGTDPHSLNAVAIGIDPQGIYTPGGRQAKGRDIAKTFIYAFLLGAGDEKVGSITGKSANEGKAIKASFLKKTPALKKLLNDLRVSIYGGELTSGKMVKGKGHIVGLDGRHVPIHSAHVALAFLLQATEAIIMKQSLVYLYEDLSTSGYVHGRDYGFCANVHDEWQIETRTKEIANDVGNKAVEAIRKTGEHFKFRCPLDGAFKIGRNWRETH